MVNCFTTWFILSLALIGYCTSCTLPRLQERKEYADIQAGNRTVFLLRVTNEEAGGGTATDALGNISYGLGGFDTGGEVKPDWFGGSVFPLSDQATQQGWVYYTLKPGVHYFAFYAPPQHSGHFHSVEHIKSAQRWIIEIPKGSRLIYGGTVHLLCQKVKTLLTEHCLNVPQWGVVKNEEGLAREVASQYLRELGVPKTLLLQPYRGGPIVIKKPQ